MTKNLYIVATPIGNLGDISMRAIEILKGVDHILCEDTRVSEKLLNSIAPGHKFSLIVYNDHNAQNVIPKIIERILNKNEVFAIISDAGTPLISDPGYKLVNACYNNNIEYSFIPGASSVISALVLSGMPSDRFLFDGFVDKKNFEELSKIESTIILFESPKRLISSLKIMKNYFKNRTVAIVREITKIFEEIKRGNFDDIIEYYSNRDEIKGEIVIVLSPPNIDNDAKLNELSSLIIDMLQKMSKKDACEILSRYTNISKNAIYNFIINNNLE